MSRQHTYIAIDLKSFYALVECVDRGLDPLTTNLVVADVSMWNRAAQFAPFAALTGYDDAIRKVTV